MRYLYVLAGGAAGSLLRYSVGVLVLARYSGNFPLGTFIVNIAGSFLIGFAMSHLPAGSLLRPLLVTGLLGGYTTFSALQWETFFAVQNGLPIVAICNMLGSVLAGYAACWAGAWLSSTLK
jgi:CrcB protein